MAAAARLAARGAGRRLARRVRATQPHALADPRAHRETRGDYRVRPLDALGMLALECRMNVCKNFHLEAAAHVVFARSRY